MRTYSVTETVTFIDLKTCVRNEQVKAKPRSAKPRKAPGPSAQPRRTKGEELDLKEQGATGKDIRLEWDGGAGGCL